MSKEDVIRRFCVDYTQPDEQISWGRQSNESNDNSLHGDKNGTTSLVPKKGIKSQRRSFDAGLSEVDRKASRNRYRGQRNDNLASISSNSVKEINRLKEIADSSPFSGSLRNGCNEEHRKATEEEEDEVVSVHVNLIVFFLL